MIIGGNMKAFLIVGLFVFYFTRLFLYVQQRIINKSKIKSLNDYLKKALFLLIDIIGIFILTFQLLDIISLDLMVLNHIIIKGVGYFLFTTGIILSTYSRFYLGKNWDTAGAGGIKINHKLITSGPYSFSRHPIYLGTLCLFVGLEILLHSWIIILSIPLFILIQWESNREEKLLLNYFPAYSKYQNKVKKFLDKKLFLRK
jgi:protein-S-isoprenylcysteine O-methyltransferase Ste14